MVSGHGRLGVGLLFAAALALAVAQAAVTRTHTNPDGIAYLDIARAYRAGDWHGALNSYWSPLYSWLLAASLLVTGASRADDVWVAHGLNVLIYAAALGALWLYVRELAAAFDLGERRGSRAFVLLGAFGIFIWATFSFTTAGGEVLLRATGLVTPDLLVVAIVLAQAALVARLSRSEGKRAWLALGALIGVGYLAKTAMLPIGLGFLAGGAVAARTSRWRGVLVCAASAAVFVVPYAAAISAGADRLTVGDSGVLNFAWALHPPAPPVSAADEPALVHPARLVSASPAIYAFAPRSREESFTLFDRPGYWYDGTPVRWSWGAQSAILTSSAHAYRRMTTSYGALLPVAILAAALGAVRLRSRPWRAIVAVGVGPVIALLSYALVDAEPRYVAGPWIVIGTVLVALGIGWPRRVAFGIAALIVALSVIGAVRPFRGGIDAERAELPWTGSVQWDVARGLRSAGVREGDRVSIVGNPYEALWAHIDGLQITRMPKLAAVSTFWSASPACVRAGLDALSRDGRQYVVADPAPTFGAQSEWRRLGRTGFMVLAPRAAERRQPSTC